MLNFCLTLKNIKVKKTNENIIVRTSQHLKNKYGVITKLQLDEEETNWDISGISQKNVVKTYTVKYTKTQSNGRVPVELFVMVNNEKQPSGIGKSNSDYLIFVFEDEPDYYLIARQKFMEFVEQKRTPYAVDKYTLWVRGYMLMFFDKKQLIKKCKRF